MVFVGQLVFTDWLETLRRIDIIAHCPYALPVHGTLLLLAKAPAQEEFCSGRMWAVAEDRGRLRPVGGRINFRESNAGGNVIARLHNPQLADCVEAGG